MSEKYYSVYIDDDLIGYARDIQDDMPWRKGRFEATDLFDKYRKLFELEKEFSESKKWLEREKLLEAIDKLGLKLVSSTNETYKPSLGNVIDANYVSHGFALFHIREGKVSWRPT
jgi:hypothetical protein